jgi:hypothetical protein
MADGVDTAVEAMKATGVQPVSDGLPSKAEANELPVRNHPVLPIRQLRELQVTRVDLLPLCGA